MRKSEKLSKLSIHKRHASVTLGNIDDVDIFNMEAGWTASFNVTSPGNATIELDWRLLQSPDYESDEVSTAFVDLDGIVYTLGSLTGDGNGGPLIDTGEQFASIDLGILAAGSHTLTLGGTNNKKTFNNEFTQAYFTDVSVVVEFGGTPH